LVPTSSQIRLFGAPNQGNTISRALTTFLSRRASSSRFHRRHSNKSSSKPPTSAIKVNLKKLAPAFRSLCLFPRWLLLPGESTRPSTASQRTTSNSHRVIILSSLFRSSHLQTTQLAPEQAPNYLESPADEATPGLVRNPQTQPCRCMRTTPATVASRRPHGGASRAGKRSHGATQRSIYPTACPAVPPP
jgi:hypothetical protein